MQMNLPTRPTQGPMRGVPETSGSEDGSSAPMRFRESGVRVSPVRSVNDGGEIADLVGFVEQAGLFFAGLTVAKEFHLGSDGIWS